MSEKKFTHSIKTLTLEEILQISEGELFSHNHSLDIIIKGVASPECATKDDLIFFNHLKYAHLIAKSKAAICITCENLAEHVPKEMAVVLALNPYKSYALVAQKLYYASNAISYIAPSAVIAKSAKIDDNCVIHENVVIGAGVILAANVTILANSVIGNNVEIGSDSKIGANVSIENAIIGKRVIIHSGARLGQDGFGFASDQKGHYKVPQLGGVIIGDDVEIGSNSTVDRGALGNTEIGAMTKIDNLVHIAHNVKIGLGCIIIAQVGIAGSCVIGNGVVLGGQVGVAGHLKIADGAQIAAQGGVISDVLESKKYGGTPVVPLRDWHKQSIMLNRIIKRSDK
jgi:UDP-3-O-[3-hydroxymyristoyl] glucosamine N-acyltransferase